MRHALTVSLALAAILAFASLARADATANWNGTGCTLRVVEGQAHVAVLSCRNVLTGGQPITRADLAAEGVTVGLTVFHGPGDIPDRFVVVPADGFYAVPSEVDIEEDDGADVLIYEWVGM